MKFTAIQGIRNLINLVFPNICIACSENSPMKGRSICLQCDQELIFTAQESERNNPFENHFLGRIPLEKGAAMYVYRKNTAIQNILQELKYKGNSSAGLQLGMEFGHKLKESGFMVGVTSIVPVPLHWKKKRLRGYNQAEVFGKGISLSTGIPMHADLLLKEIETGSQTSMDRAERADNVDKVFSLNPDYELENETILLVDDVLTTGATLEACAKMFDFKTTKILMATIAIGRM